MRVKIYTFFLQLLSIFLISHTVKLQECHTLRCTQNKQNYFCEKLPKSAVERLRWKYEEKLYWCYITNVIILMNRASKQLKPMNLKKQIVIGKDPKQSNMEKHIISVKKRKKNPKYKSILFKSTLKSNLYFSSSTLTHITYLFLNATEVLYRSAWAMADKWPATNSLMPEETPGFGYLQPGSVFCTPCYEWHCQYTSEWFKNQRLYEAEALCYNIVLKHKSLHIHLQNLDIS